MKVERKRSAQCLKASSWKDAKVVTNRENGVKVKNRGFEVTVLISKTDWNALVKVVQYTPALNDVIVASMFSPISGSAYRTLAPKTLPTMVLCSH